MAEPANLVDPRTDCGNEWTLLSSEPVRRMHLLITGCMFVGGSALLSIAVFLPWSDPNTRIVVSVIWMLWTTLTGIGFLAALMLWLKKEPDVLLSRPSILSGKPIALRWQLPAGMKKRAIKIELCGQEEWTHVVRRDTQTELYRFLTLALVDLPESDGQREAVVCFRPPVLAASAKENAHKIRYWINVRNLRSTLSSFEYDVTVRQ
jgi:hypothetical protein